MRKLAVAGLVVLAVVGVALPAQARRYWDAGNVQRNHVKVKPNLVTIKESLGFRTSPRGIPLTIVAHCNVHYKVRRWAPTPDPTDDPGAIYEMSYRAGEKLKMVKPAGERRSSREWVVARR